MTKKPFSSISFNTHEYLSMRCLELLHDGHIQTFMFIHHHPEKDTTKDHFHLILIPARPCDPLAIRKRFIEPSFVKGESDLGCLPFQPSKVSDWLLYALHYPPYLLKKGLVRVNSYNLCEIETNEQPVYLEQMFSEASESLADSRIDLFMERMKKGDSFGEILASGLVPPNQVVFFDKLYRLNIHRFSGGCDL